MTSTGTALLALTLAVPLLGLLGRWFTGCSWRHGVALSLVALGAGLLWHTGLDGTGVVTLNGFAEATPTTALGVLLLGLLCWQIDRQPDTADVAAVSPLIDVLLATLVAAWLTQHALVLLGLSGLTLALSFMLLGWKSRWSAAGSQARQLWLGVATSDLWLIVTVVLLVGTSGPTLDDVGTPARLGGETAPATLRLMATVWLLGLSARCGWFPWLLGHDQALQPSSSRTAWIALALMSTGLRWFEVGAGWFQSTPEATAAISTWLSLSAVLCVWTAWALEDPRRRVLYLVSAQLALTGFAVLNAPSATPWSFWGPAWTVLAAGLIVLASCPAAVMSSPSGPGGWQWSVSTEGGGVRVFASTAPPPVDVEPSPNALDEPAIESVNIVPWIALAGLLPWPLWWDTARPASFAMVLGVAIGQGGLAFVAARLVWQQRATLKFDASCLAGLVIVLLPWGMTWAASGLPRRWPTDAGFWQLLAATVGLVAAMLATSPLARGLGEAFQPFVRAGRNRFSLGSLAHVFWNLPIRGVAQLVRFLDRLVIDALVPSVVRQGPEWAADESRHLRSGGAGFYALSLGLSSALLLFTLLWMSR